MSEAKKRAKKSKWLFAFAIGGSTVITDLGVQIANALGNHADVNVTRSLVTGAVITALTRLIGMGISAYVTSKEKEEEEDGSAETPSGTE